MMTKLRSHLAQCEVAIAERSTSYLSERKESGVEGEIDE